MAASSGVVVVVVAVVAVMMAVAVAAGEISDDGGDQPSPSPSPSASCARRPVVFAFGDSNTDTGGIAAGMGYYFPLPEGRAFFRRATGRLCDGRLVIDHLCESHAPYTFHLPPSTHTPPLQNLWRWCVRVHTKIDRLPFQDFARSTQTGRPIEHAVTLFFFLFFFLLLCFYIVYLKRNSTVT